MVASEFQQGMITDTSGSVLDFDCMRGILSEITVKKASGFVQDNYSGNVTLETFFNLLGHDPLQGSRDTMQGINRQTRPNIP
jgi:hypothetical protein